jgi:hypothetical protein
MIYKAFCDVLPKNNVFMDVDSILPGRRWRDALKEALDQCEVTLALIGPDWMDARDSATGSRRLDNEIALSTNRDRQRA